MFNFRNLNNNKKKEKKNIKTGIRNIKRSNNELAYKTGVPRDIRSCPPLVYQNLISPKLFDTVVNQPRTIFRVRNGVGSRSLLQETISAVPSKVRGSPLQSSKALTKPSSVVSSGGNLSLNHYKINSISISAGETLLKQKQRCDLPPKQLLFPSPILAILEP